MYHVEIISSAAHGRSYRIVEKRAAGAPNVVEILRTLPAARDAADRLNAGTAQLAPHAPQGSRVQPHADALALAQRLGSVLEVGASAVAQRDAEERGEIVWRD